MRAEALAQLDRAKTVFFSNVSHEFRTPLTLMLGPTEEALASPDARALGRSARDRASQRAAPAQAGQHAPRFLAHRSRTLGRELRADRPGRVHRRRRQHVPLGVHARRPGIRRRLSRAVAAGLRRPGDVGEDRPEPPLERLEVHARRVGPPVAPRARRIGRARACAIPASAFPTTRSRTCSSGFIASRAPAPAPTKAPASGSRSSASWSGCTAAR